MPVVEVGSLDIGRDHLLSQMRWPCCSQKGPPLDAILRDGEMNNGNKSWQLVRYQMIMTSFFLVQKEKLKPSTN